jgi:hypothetical protein
VETLDKTSDPSRFVAAFVDVGELAEKNASKY